MIGRLPNFTAMGRPTPYLRSPHGACGDNLCSLVSCRMGLSFPYGYGGVAVESLRYLPESLCANSGIIHGFPRNRPEIMAKARPSHTKSHDRSPSTGLRNWRFVSDLEAWLQRCRNLSPDQDPDMAVQDRWMFPAIFAIFIFILCRLVFYSLDFAGLREQPLGAYKTVNRFVLFL